VQRSPRAEDKTSRSIVDQWSVRPWTDYAVTLAVLAAHVLVTRFTKHGDWIRWIPEGQQVTAYGTGATVISIIGGFSAIAVSVYLAASGDRARAVRASYGDILRSNWRAILIGLGLATILCLIAQVLDTTNDPFSTRFIFEAAMLIAVLRFLRLVWLFDALIRVADRDLTDTPHANAPEISKVWMRRAGNRGQQ
jgi:hypothetical protein